VAPWAGRVDDEITGDGAPVGETDAGDPSALLEDTGDLGTEANLAAAGARRLDEVLVGAHGIGVPAPRLVEEALRGAADVVGLSGAVEGLATAVERRVDPPQVVRVEHLGLHRLAEQLRGVSPDLLGALPHEPHHADTVQAGAGLGETGELRPGSIRLLPM